MGKSSVAVAVATSVAAALGLAGCSGSINAPMWNCPEASTEQAKGVDWEKVRVIPVRIRQGEMNPMILTLRKDQAYKIQIENADDHTHVFNAHSFFHDAAAVKRLTVGGEEQGTCFSSIWIAGGKTAEVELLAVRDGRYDVVDSYLPLSDTLTARSDGVIVVNYSALTATTASVSGAPPVPPAPQEIPPAPSPVAAPAEPVGQGLFGTVPDGSSAP